ncbi:MAG: thioredoxin domain-containing protein [Fretibacterium sp.]|uniref:thioredoxin family protein n=1 Tax=Fretibacterium sp. OH1220_COT-178 TaxID=2491047 RepID=UPI000F5FB556|nr:thioredoxin domain-containing protein [Fretibacterium sp. OH1220_COT-178]MDO4786487.1 thioredoxin domain-containing protein [Fretibacterium sp.]RRD64373.1 thioredoxin [Fretibacterium sp. OH1220_COT-178]
MIELTKDNCDAEVKESALPVVMDFWGPACGPCMALMPKYMEIAEKYEGKAKFCKVDTSKNKRVAINFKVMSLPTILFWKDGKEFARLGGADATAENITAKVEELIG